MRKTVNMDLVDHHDRDGVIKKIRGSNKLYIDIYLHGKRVVKSTRLDDTPANRDKVIRFLAKLAREKNNGTLDFARAFPGASEEEKAFHARMAGHEYQPQPNAVLFGDYASNWLARVLPTFDSNTKRQDFAGAIDYRIIPFFGKLTFAQISGVVIQQFMATLVWGPGKNEGKKLSRSRINNILIPLRALWEDACCEYRWLLPDPFLVVKKHLPKKGKRRDGVFRFADWQAFVAEVPPFYRPVVEFLVLTGMIGSEVSGLRKSDVTSDYIIVENSIVRGEESEDLKNDYRHRKIPMTMALKCRIDEAMRHSKTEYVFVMENGTPFNYGSFYKTIWRKAIERAGVGHRVAYIARHTFAAWSLTVGLHPLKLVRLMGHGSKQMVYEVYGNYIEDLEEDADDILKYFGQDFLDRKKQKPQSLTGESSGESQGLHIANYLK